MVKFYKDSKAKATMQTRPILQYEDPIPKAEIFVTDQVTQVAFVKPKASAQHDGEDDEDDTFIPESRIQKRFDLTEPSRSRKEESISHLIDGAGDEPKTNGNVQPGASTLAQAYNRNKQSSALDTTSLKKGTPPSIWDDLDSKPRAKNAPKANVTTFQRTLKPNTSSRNKEDARQQAKIFFDTAKQVLSKEHLLKTQQLLVTMKTHGGEAMLSI
jgi:hypothetical protein